MANSKTHPGYRDAGNGRFISEKKAEQRPRNTWVKERIPNAGHGDTKKGK